MLRPQVLGFGDAREFLAGLKPHEQAAANLPPRLLVGAFLFGHGRVSGPDLAERCVEELRAQRGDALCVVIDAVEASSPFLQTRARRFAASVVRAIDIMSPLALGRDVLVFAIHASTASQRDVIAPRIAEFAERPIQFGDSVVLSAKRLEHASIRATLQEDLL